MIKKENITREWLQEVGKQYKVNDLALVEKVNRALLLLEGLVVQNISFVFKGGTALMLHHQSTKRLSIDIDIVLPQKPKNWELLLKTIAEQQGFLKVEPQDRASKVGEIPKAHYKFYYQSAVRPNNAEDVILLDVLIEEVQYKKLIELPIQSPFVPQEGEPMQVKVPSIEDLLADKLTAFAPGTTGIPYYRGDKEMNLEMIKQLFDLGNLFDDAQDISIVKETYQRFAQTELAYRKMDSVTIDDVLEDTFQTALTICSRGKLGTADFESLQKGISKLKSFVLGSFYIDHAILAATKVAYVISLLRNQADNIQHFENAEQVRDWQIEDSPYNRLNKLKKTSPEAFYYWNLIANLENIGDA